MKIFLQNLLFFLLLTQICYPQWTNQNPFPGNYLGGVFFIDDNTGWISGGPIQFIDQNTGWRCGGGVVKKTINAGFDWIQQTGTSGINKTTNGGENWFELSTGTSEILTDLHFCDLNIGYAVGYNEIILKTTDGGTSWITLHSGSNYDLYSVDFVDPLLGFAVGGRDSSTFLKTTDGGLNWIEKTSVLNYSEKILNCVEFIDSNNGWLGSGYPIGGAGNGRGLMSKTTDGGQTWITNTVYRPIEEEEIINNEHETDILIDTQFGIRSIYFTDANNGYAVSGMASGWKRGILCTTDGGATWASKYFNDEQTGLLAVFVTNGGKGWAVGYAGVIYITEDDGSTWSQILSGSLGSWTGDRIYSVFMVNDSVGWAAGSRKGSQRYPIILKTTSGGKVWKTIYERSISWYNYFSEIFFINEIVGWASRPNNGFFKTTDGGINWNSSGLPADEIFFMNNDIGWTAASLSGPYGISKTTDGGANWVQKSSAASRSIYFSDINNGWAVGDGGSILKSTDTGENWISKTSCTTSTLNSVRFHDSNIGMCAGNSGTVLLSTNGGENWVSQSLGTTATLNSVAITNATTAWIAGNEGTLQRTTDLGNSWNSYSGLTGDLTSLHFLNECTGWVVDGGNNIYKYFVEPIPLVTLIAPNGGEIWKSGWQRNITWSSENISNINLYYSTNSGSTWNTIATNVDANSGSYNWTIPILTWFLNLNCKVKIEDASNPSVYDESDNNFIIWHFCNIIQYANLGQRIIDFLETNIDISLNVTTSDNISVTYYPYETPTGGTLPSGVVVLSDYYWHVTSTNLIFNDGKIIVPISTLRGVTDATKLVWLKRTNPGDDWENIGGIVSGDNLESTVLFNSLSEFAIGSTDPVNPLPVELYSFEASVSGSLVNLKWKTKTEVNNYGFEVERCLENSWEKIGFIQGYGNSNSPKSYSFSDNNPFGGSKFQYRLKQIDTDGPFEYSDIVEVEILPIKFALFQNYPNPFNPTTKIRYQLPEESKVIIKIYDILGTEVALLVNEKREPGTYEVELNSNSLSSGTYIYRIIAGDFVETRKMVLLR